MTGEFVSPADIGAPPKRCWRSGVRLPTSHFEQAPQGHAEASGLSSTLRNPMLWAEHQVIQSSIHSTDIFQARYSVQDLRRCNALTCLPWQVHSPVSSQPETDDGPWQPRAVGRSHLEGPSAITVGCTVARARCWGEFLALGYRVSMGGGRERAKSGRKVTRRLRKCE